MEHRETSRAQPPCQLSLPPAPAVGCGREAGGIFGAAVPTVPAIPAVQGLGRGFVLGHLLCTCTALGIDSPQAFLPRDCWRDFSRRDCGCGAVNVFGKPQHVAGAPGQGQACVMAMAKQQVAGWALGCLGGSPAWLPTARLTRKLRCRGVSEVVSWKSSLTWSVAKREHG